MEFSKTGVVPIEADSQSEQGQSANVAASGQRWRKGKNTGLSIFIAKTYQILENGQYTDIITWNEHGTNFTIVDVERFEAEILPIYFRHRNFSSFVRQLNMYDFHKIRNEKNLSMFEHKEFRRGAKDSLGRIRRKGCTSRKPDEEDGYHADETSKNIAKPIDKPSPSHKDKIRRHHKLEKSSSKADRSIHRLGHSNKQNSAPKNSKGDESLKYKTSFRKQIDPPKQSRSVRLASRGLAQSPNFLDIPDLQSENDISNQENIFFTSVRKESPSRPSKKDLLDEFISTVPEILYSEQQIHERIKQLKGDPKYRCLSSSKDDLRRIYKKLKHRRVPQPEEQLEELSIQEEIMVENMDLDQNYHGSTGYDHRGNYNNQNQSHIDSSLYAGFGMQTPMLAVVSTQKFLPNHSVSLIGSLNHLGHGEDIEGLLYGHHI